MTASLDSAESQCIRSVRQVTSCRGGQVELVVWLAQMVPAMPSILGDHSRLRTGRIWRWCRKAPPPRGGGGKGCGAGGGRVSRVFAPLWGGVWPRGGAAPGGPLGGERGAPQPQDSHT